jgi:phenylpropionate dioxygenase-like ring-hydroxylating dioxygenase large terminal subunit
MNFIIVASFLLLLITGSQSYISPRYPLNKYNHKVGTNVLRESLGSEDISLENTNTAIIRPSELFDLSWYVIGSPNDFTTNKPKKVRVWNTDYVVWCTKEGNYVGLDNVCPHRGASLANGKVCKGNIICPYHGYEFDQTGYLVKIPGISFTPTPIHNLKNFLVKEHNDWVYINIQSVDSTTNAKPFFMEPEADGAFSRVHLNMDFNCYSRVLSENSLDIMHIAFVHTFGNSKQPNPIHEIPPTRIGPNHYKTTYSYSAGEKSVAKRVFGINDLIIENEFILPHTTVARVIFGKFVSTVITFALPTGNNTSKLFVKTYRNFWQNPLGDVFTRDTMYKTILQDKAVIEGIDARYVNGKFNMRFDKLQNTYISLYKKLVENLSK